MILRCGWILRNDSHATERSVIRPFSFFAVVVSNVVCVFFFELKLIHKKLIGLYENNDCKRSQLHTRRRELVVGRVPKQF